MSLSDFAANWCYASHPPKPVSADELASLEAQFAVRLPVDYRTEMLATGSVYAPLLAEELSRVDSDLEELREILPPSVAAEQTAMWREIGLPETLIAFGSDGGGNLFCFDETDLKAETSSSAPVYFWDHDFDETREIASSFTSLIESYLNIGER